VIGRLAVRRPGSQGPDATVSWQPAILAMTGAGLLLIGLADQQARVDGPLSLPLFWAGILSMVAPSTWRLVGTAATRNERISIVLTMGLALYLVKIMASPLTFSLPDELTHWRTLNDILASGHLFADNPLLRLSPVYPGLEAATAAAKVSSGLAVFPLAMILLAAARAVTMLSLFLLATIITGSARVAGVACVIYMGNVSFLPFDAQFAYESLGLPLAFVAMWAVLSWSRHAGRSVLYGGLGLTAIAATAMTHHVTAFALTAFLVAWALLSLVRFGGNTPRWPVVVAAGWSVAVNLAWLASVGGPAVTYIRTIILGGVNELAEVLTGASTPKQLFLARPGFAAPLPEIVVAYAAVGLLLLALPFMSLHAVRGRRPPAIVVVLVLAALLYPASLALRFTVAGSETSQRAPEFLFVALGILGADWLVGSRPSPTRPGSRWIVAPVLLVVFAGGIVSGDPPQGRLPGPYHVGAEQRSIEPQGVDTARWALTELGPNNRLIADRTNAKLLASIGGQDPVTSATEHLGTAYVVFARKLGPGELDVLVRGRIRYVVVDLRLARDLPIYKYYFESAEPDAARHTSPIPLAALQKFDTLKGVTRIYDSGDIVIYDMRGLVNAIP
jgi:hypothetical protein